MDAPPLPLAVVGGGVAGLAVAVALQRRGLPCRVFERDPSCTRAHACTQACEPAAT